MGYKLTMTLFPSWLPRRALTAGTVPLLLVALAGCSHPAPPPVQPPPAQGVSLNSGGDTRGTVLYRPVARPAKAPDPYALVSDKFVIGRRRQMGWALAEIDDHAHRQAENAYPVPDQTWRGYTKLKALAEAQRQAAFNAYLLEKYHARFCNQYRVSYDQLILIIQEGREQGWPMPPPAKE